MLPGVFAPYSTGSLRPLLPHFRSCRCVCPCLVSCVQGICRALSPLYRMSRSRSSSDARYPALILTWWYLPLPLSGFELVSSPCVYRCLSVELVITTTHFIQKYHWFAVLFINWKVHFLIRIVALFNPDRGLDLPHPPLKRIGVDRGSDPDPPPQKVPSPLSPASSSKDSSHASSFGPSMHHPFLDVPCSRST